MQRDHLKFETVAAAPDNSAPFDLSYKFNLTLPCKNKINEIEDSHGYGDECADEPKTYSMIWNINLVVLKNYTDDGTLLMAWELTE